MIVLSALLVIAAVVLYAFGRSRDNNAMRLSGGVSGAAGVLLAIVSCVYVVGAYEVGVPVAFGKIGTPWNSGVHFKTPFTSVTSFSTRPVDLNLSGDDVVEVRSSQGGVMYAELTVKWAVTPARAVELYRLAGTEEAIQQRLVHPDSREIVRNVFARHTSEEGYATGREKINAEIGKLIKERLAPRGIDVTTVNLRNVKPSEKLQDQIDKKIQQEQETLRAKEAALTAKAKAEQSRIEAEAAAERKRIESEATAKANRTLNKSLTDKVLLSQCIEAYESAAQANPVYAVPCGTGSDGTPVIVDSTKD